MSDLNEVSLDARRGNAAWDDFERTGHLPELDSAITTFRAAVAAMPAGDPGRAIHLHDLLGALHQRFLEVRNMADLEEAITAGREAVALARTNAGHLSALSSVLLKRFEACGQVADLDEAIVLGRIAARLPPTRSPDGEYSMANLGAVLSARFRATGSLDDLTESIGLKRSALALSRPGISRKHALHDLAHGLCMLFETTGRAEAWDEAVDLARRAVGARPREGRRQSSYVHALGYVLSRRCAHDDTTAGLDEAIACARTAFNDTSASHRDRERYLARLVADLALYARLSDGGTHLDEAVRLARCAAVNAPGSTEHDARSGYSLILMVALQSRFGWGGELSDLDEAVAVGRASAARTEGDLRARWNYLRILADVLFERYRQVRSIADLDEAVAYVRSRLETGFGDRGERADGLSSLGTFTWTRFLRTRDVRDLEESVDLCREAVAANAWGNEQAWHLANYAVVLEERFAQSGQLSDLDEAIETGRRAIARMTNERAGSDPTRYYSHLARYNANLAHFLHRRFDRTGRPEDLDEAVAAGRRSVDLISSRNPERSRFLVNLGAALRARHEYAGVNDDVTAALDAMIEASAVETAPAWQRVGAARLAAADLVRMSDVRAAAEVLDRAVRLLPEVSPRRLARDDQQHALKDVAGLAGEAASVILADASLPDADRTRRALSLLEAGRQVIINQALDGRDDLSELRRGHPDLAARFVELRNQLDRQWEPSLPARAAESGPDSAVPAGGSGRDRHELSAEFAATMGRIRQLDGFDSFGLPPSPDDLLGAAREGPVAVLNFSAYGSHALLVTRAEVIALPLPRLSQEGLTGNIDAFLSAQHSIVKGDIAQQARGEAELIVVLEWLWDAVAGPVLDALGYQGRPSGAGDWPRVWWVPCGLLSMLPVHAAGYHRTAASDQCPRTVLDRVVSSYTPSLRALMHTRRRIAALAAVAPATVVPRALVVAMSTTPGLPGLGRLPHVLEEVEALRRHFPELTVLGGETDASGDGTVPTKNTVLEQLAGHPIAHFCCHGQSDALDPSRSRLLLQDHERDPLSVASLAPVALDGVQLAYLSACNTAATHRMRLFDESVHLASAFQIAGFPHVISTLWEIEDRLSVSIADNFYANLLIATEGARDVHRPAYALHHAIRTARDGDGTLGATSVIQNPFLWASFVHIGA
jgi:tetratricopeptide (TPR) repeat protein